MVEIEAPTQGETIAFYGYRIRSAGFDESTFAAAIDRAKWICITASGSMIVIGQALPVNTSEPQDEVEQRSCDVVEATITWLTDDVFAESFGTPSASPTSDPSD